MSVQQQPADPHLRALSVELERLGYVVVPHGAHICVRLPLLCSVVVRVESGRFHFRPQFGPFGRTDGLLVTSAASMGVVGGTALAAGAGPLAFVAVFLGVILLAHDGCRFVITEGCLTRLQQLVAAPHSALTGDAATHALPESAPASAAAIEANREIAVAGAQRTPVGERRR